jgi:hypothetical protein
VASWPETDKAVDFQSLEYLALQGLRNELWDFPDLGAQILRLFSHGPRLVTFIAGHNLWCYPRQEFSFPWSQLTRLSLSEPIPPQKWTDILDECINLKFGSFSFYHPEDENMIGTEALAPTQTSLQNLHLSFDGYDLDVFQLLRTRIFLNVVVLTIESMHEHNIGGQYYLQSHLPSLKHLALTNCCALSERLLPILFDNPKVTQISLEMARSAKFQMAFFNICSSGITRDTMPYLSSIKMIALSSNAINFRYVKAFSQMVSTWFNGATSNRDNLTQKSYSVQFQMPSMGARFVSTFYEQLEACTNQGLNLVVKADYIPGSLGMETWG